MIRQRKRNAVLPTDSYLDSDAEWNKILNGTIESYTDADLNKQSINKSYPWKNSTAPLPQSVARLNSGNSSGVGVDQHPGRNREPGSDHPELSFDSTENGTRLPPRPNQGSASMQIDSTTKKMKTINVKPSPVNESKEIFIDLGNEIVSVYSQLKISLLAYKSKYEDIIKETKTSEIEIAKLETELEDVEEENAQLQVLLVNGSDAHHRTRHRQAAVKAEQNAFEYGQDSAEYRKILLSGGQDDENFDDALELSDDLRLRVMKYWYKFIARYTPFEVETRIIHSTFGGAVAAYFIFFRWM